RSFRWSCRLAGPIALREGVLEPAAVHVHQSRGSEPTQDLFRRLRRAVIGPDQLGELSRDERARFLVHLRLRIGALHGPIASVVRLPFHLTLRTRTTP